MTMHPSIIVSPNWRGHEAHPLGFAEAALLFVYKVVARTGIGCGVKSEGSRHYQGTDRQYNSPFELGRGMMRPQALYTTLSS